MKKMIKYILFSFLAAVLMSSCISSEEINYMQNLPQDYKLASFEEYRLAVRDNVSCRITIRDEESRKIFRNVIVNDPTQNEGLGLVIYEDSTVVVPFFGNVKIAGLTLQEAEMEIQEMMMESFPDAQVKMTLLSNYFYIYADDRQGSYRVYKENMTIYQALAISGQTTANMDLSNVKIIRKGQDGQDMIKEFDLRSSNIIQSEFYYIKPNDVIYFSTSKKSFFNVTSVQSFISMIMTPLTFLFMIATYSK